MTGSKPEDDPDRESEPEPESEPECECEPYAPYKCWDHSECMCTVAKRRDTLPEAGECHYCHQVYTEVFHRN